MKKIIFIVLALAVSFTVAAKDKDPFDGWNKLDLGAKDSFNAWKNTEAEVMVRTTVPVKKDEKKILNIVGFKYRSVIPYKDKGSILTGSIPMEHMDELAKVAFVDYIEGAIKLTPKAEGHKGPGVFK